MAPKTRAFLSIRLKDKRWRSDKTSLPRDSTNDLRGGGWCFLGFLDEEGVETRELMRIEWLQRLVRHNFASMGFKLLYFKKNKDFLKLKNIESFSDKIEENVSPIFCETLYKRDHIQITRDWLQKITLARDFSRMDWKALAFVPKLKP